MPAINLILAETYPGTLDIIPGGQTIDTSISEKYLSEIDILPSGSTLSTILGPVIRGEQGLPGTNDLISTTLTAGTNIGGHRAVYSSSGSAYISSSDESFSAQRVLGVCTNAAVSGDPIVVVTFGEVQEPSWSWSNGPVYLGIDGLLTQTAPSTGTLVALGYAIASDTIHVRIQQALFLGD